VQTLFSLADPTFLFGFVFGLLRGASIATGKIGLVNSGFIKVGAESVNLEPERDNQQLTYQNLCLS
jgi:hypothetical protein